MEIVGGHVRPNRRTSLGLLLALAIPASAISACGIAGTTTTNLVVDFSDPFAVSARDTVRTACGSLPGISPVPARPKDASVYFDIQHASNVQINALDTCVSDLQAKQPQLGIRGYRIDDGTGS